MGNRSVSRDEKIPPPKIRLDNQDVVVHESAIIGINYVSTVRPLELYVTRAWINQKQYDAGKTFHDVWWFGCMRSPYVQVKYQESTESRWTEKMPLGAYAEEYREAMLAIRGMKERRIAYKVCCEPEDFAGQGSNMIRLKNALDDLAKHWHI